MKFSPRPWKIGAILGTIFWIWLCAIDTTTTLWHITGHTLLYGVISFINWKSVSRASFQISTAWKRRYRLQRKQKPSSRDSVVIETTTNTSSHSTPENEEEEEDTQNKRNDFGEMIATPQNVRPGLFAVVFIISAVIRANLISWPGFIKWILASVCASSLMLLFVCVVPFAVIIIMFCVAWLIVTLLWIAPEICKSTAAAHGICNVFWKYQILIVFIISGFLLYKYYRRVGLTLFVKHCVLTLMIFPPTFLFLFACCHWSLISIAPFWMYYTPYTKSHILSFLPEENLLGNYQIFV